MKEEIFKFNDKIAIQSQVYKTLWGARNIDQLTDIKIFRQCQRTDDWCQSIIEYITNYDTFKDSIELEELKEFQKQLYKALIKNEFVINDKTELIEKILLTDDEPPITIQVPLVPPALVTIAIEYAHWLRF